MKLYHGSDVTVEKINLAKCRPFKDFGRGFYLSDNYDQALLSKCGYVYTFLEEEMKRCSVA